MRFGIPRLLAVCALVGSVAVAGCTSTVSGTAARAPEVTDPDGADVALMDTGPYEITPGRPLGTVGDDVYSQGLIEANRMSPYVTGPWQVEESLVLRDGYIATGTTGPVPSTAEMARLGVTSDVVADVASRHRFVAGFSTVRLAAPQDGQQQLILHNAVFRFPDAAAAEQAAAEMAAVTPPPAGAEPAVPIQFGSVPGAFATSYATRSSDGTPSEVVVSYTPHGPYVLHQVAQASNGDFEMFGISARLLAENCASRQQKLIDQFAPTEMSKLSELPLDATGQLLAKTLRGPDEDAPFMLGAWDPRGWLHFEDNPIVSSRLFSDAGVKTVTQWLTTIYEAGDVEGATRVVDTFAQEIGKSPSVRPVGGVPGLPVARCFERADGLPATAPSSWQRVMWRYKCVARADQFAFTAFSDDIGDVKQQTAAQYRILTGK